MSQSQPNITSTVSQLTEKLFEEDEEPTPAVDLLEFDIKTRLGHYERLTRQLISQCKELTTVSLCLLRALRCYTSASSSSSFSTNNNNNNIIHEGTVVDSPPSLTTKNSLLPSSSEFLTAARCVGNPIHDNKASDVYFDSLVKRILSPESVTTTLNKQPLCYTTELGNRSRDYWVRRLLQKHLLKWPSLLGHDNFIFYDLVNGKWEVEIFKAFARVAPACLDSIAKETEEGWRLVSKMAGKVYIDLFRDPRRVQLQIIKHRIDRIESDGGGGGGGGLVAELSQLLQWTHEALLERSETKHNQESSSSVLAIDIFHGNVESNSSSVSAEALQRWDGDFSKLNLVPLPTDYGKSEKFDKRGSMRYIQLSANFPQIPPAMEAARESSSNFGSWYAVTFGSGMWKAEVIVDQQLSKRNSFQRSLRQCCYMQAQLEVMRWLLQKCTEFKIPYFRYKGRRDEFLIVVDSKKRLQQKSCSSEEISNEGATAEVAIKKLRI